MHNSHARYWDFSQYEEHYLSPETRSVNETALKPAAKSEYILKEECFTFKMVRLANF